MRWPWGALPKKNSYPLEEPGHKLQTIVRAWSQAADYSPSLVTSCQPLSVRGKTGISRMSRSCGQKRYTQNMAHEFRWRYSPRNYRIQISDDDYEMIIGHRFRQQSQYIHGDKFQGPVGGELFSVAFRLQKGAVSDAVEALAGCCVNIEDHVLPVGLGSQGVIHKLLHGVSCQLWVLKEVIERCSSVDLHYSLHCIIKRGGAN